ncbi:hypothetical protein EG352_13980 [Chryseobacterium indologenes]|uniref:Uncharacterized protein n=2 Tax=Chryseobacterium indologenes TaxID=253 RepID=A0AAD0YUX4_CHRID|nr:hypothetical protein EG352_13980 [Chryseobacterium indologenes]
MADATKEEENKAKDQGDIFIKYIAGENGLSEHLKKLNKNKYGEDILIILFQFYVNPIPYLLQNLKEIEPYRKKEKSIGIPIIVTDDNFFNRTEHERYDFLKQSILQKMDLLAEVVKKKKLDTNMDMLKEDIRKIL